MRIFPIFIPYKENGTHERTNGTSGTALGVSIFGLIFFGILGIVLGMPSVENAITEWFVKIDGGNVDSITKCLLVIKVISSFGMLISLGGVLIAFMQRRRGF